MVKVSIIVPVYNSEIHLRACINSLLDQSLDDYEIILVNDGSTDASSEIIEEYANNNKNIIVIHKPNGGASSARNEGIKVATGEYILFVDSDDLLLPNAAETLYKLISKANADIAMFRMRKISIDGKIAEEELLFEPNSEFSGQEIITRLCPLFLEGNALNEVCKNMYKTDFIKKNKLEFPQNQIIGEDLLFNLKAFSRAHKVIYTGEICYQYVRHRGSITSSEMNIGEFKNLYSELVRFAETCRIDYSNGKLCNRFSGYVVSQLIGVYLSNRKFIEKKSKVINLLKEPFVYHVLVNADYKNRPPGSRIIKVLMLRQQYKLIALILWIKSYLIRINRLLN